MAQPESDLELRPSVLDRLIDDEPQVGTEGQSSRGGRLSDLKKAVKRDLEWILNSRQILVDVPPGLSHVEESLVTFGLPDFTHASLSTADDQDRLRRTIERAIARFEPRLSDVNVALIELREFDRSLRFRIDATLKVEPKPEPITFDSLLQLPTKAFVVQGD